MNINWPGIVELLKQPSTAKGILALLALTGVGVAPASVEAIVTGAVALYGVISIFWDKH
jgi:hypothetical protein